jgi:hypothetical protein
VIFGRLTVFPGEVLDEFLRGRIFEGVIPHRRPSAAQVARAGGPCVSGIEIEADQRVAEAEFGILLDEVRDLVSREIAADHVRPSLPDLQEIGAEVGDVSRDELVANEIGVVLRKRFSPLSVDHDQRCNRPSA